MYANVKDTKIGGSFNITTIGKVAGASGDIHLTNRIVEQFSVQVKGYGHTVIGYVTAILNGGFETAGGGGADVFASWTEAHAGATALSQDAVVYHAAGGGAKSMKIVTDGSNNIGSVTQTVLTVGKQYTVSFYAIGAAGGEVVEVLDGAVSRALFGLTASWAKYNVTFTAAFTTLTIQSAAVTANISATMNIDDLVVTDVVGFSRVPTTLTGTLDVSLDGVYWTPIQALAQTGDGVVYLLTGKATQIWRVNITVFTKSGDASDYVTVSILGA
jgi:hypothetical protein